MRLRLYAITAIIFVAISSLVACQEEYTTQHFSFPPGSSPHENDWKYTGLVIVSMDKGPVTKVSQKRVTIKIYDKTKTSLLDDEFGYLSASIRADVTWNKFEEISIDLYEVGNKYAEDSYNKRLLKNGKNILSSLVYYYDQGENRYLRKR